jgi:holo-[acyl-carrier protein] synthase
VYDHGMHIIGVGLDATEIPRIARTIARHDQRFLCRVFTDEEIRYCQAHRHAAQHFAARFAVKEAAMKALGTGHSLGVLWRDVEVVRSGGPPQLRLHGAAARRFQAMGGRSSLVTITHTDDLAVAQVLLLGGAPDAGRSGQAQDPGAGGNT